MSFPYKIKVDRCVGSCNDMDNPYLRVCLPDISSVKWGHLGHFDLEPNKHNFPTNPMGSSGTLWARLYFL